MALTLIFGVPEDVRKSSRKKKLVVLFLAAVLAVLGLFFYPPATPDGVYFDPNLACGHGCWIFKDGKFYTSCDGVAPRLMGNYQKMNGEWIIQGEHGTANAILRPTIFGLKLTDKNLKAHDVFWVRDSLSWTVDFEDWLKKHF